MLTPGSFAGDVVEELSPSQPASKSPSPAAPSVPATPAAPAATTPPTQTATTGKMPTTLIGQEICTRKILKMWHEIKVCVCVCVSCQDLPAPSTIAEALQQRMDIYKSTAEGAKNKGDDRKARMYQRIVKVRTLPFKLWKIMDLFSTPTLFQSDSLHFDQK